MSCEENGNFQEVAGFKDGQNQQDQIQEAESERNSSFCNNTSTPLSKGEIKSKPFTKLFSSFCSNVFSKKAETTTPSSPGQKTNKLDITKNEQDHRMAYFIAKLQSEGRSDEEIQLHLFHLRDIAQFAPRPRSNSITEFFRNMQQAFKEELSMRRDGQSVTFSASSMSPFSAAASSNHFNDLGFTYEDLVALESVPRGVKSIDKLPVVAYTGQELPSSQTSCAICMADFETEEKLKWLQCSHYFHKECIDKWLGVATTCPVCKGEVHAD